MEHVESELQLESRPNPPRVLESLAFHPTNFTPFGLVCHNARHGDLPWGIRGVRVYVAYRARESES